MTSYGHRVRQDDCGERLVGTRFFKIILDDTIRHKKLLIPRKFISKYGQGLVNSAILKVPSGAKWVVGVVRDKIGVWFSNGWHEFAESHSLEHGHFLLFEYEGSSSFSVVICDKTATEIAYPINGTDMEGGKLFPQPKVRRCEEEAFDRHDDVHLVNKGKSSVEVYPPRKKMRGSVSVNALRGSCSPPYNATQVKMRTCNFQFPERSQSGEQAVCRGNVMQWPLEEKEGADKSTYGGEPSVVRKPQPMTEFSSQRPFFSIEITSKMLARKDLHVPVTFSAIHIGKDDKSVKLQVSDKTWYLALIRYSKYVCFSDDWNMFMKENSLNPGDVCIFESVERMLLKVTIIRGC